MAVVLPIHLESAAASQTDKNMIRVEEDPTAVQELLKT